MKKLALAIASLCLTAAPVLACPNMGGDSKSDEIKTVDKAKDKDKPATDTAKNDKKPAEKPKADKPADPKTAKPADPKKPDKVSAK